MFSNVIQYRTEEGLQRSNNKHGEEEKKGLSENIWLHLATAKKAASLLFEALTSPPFRNHAKCKRAFVF